MSSISASLLHVGDNSDPSKNPTCRGYIFVSGLFDCNLEGKYVGISRVQTDLKGLGIAELMAFDTVAIKGSLSVVGTDEKLTRESSPWDKKAWSIDQSKIKAPRRWSSATDYNYSRISSLTNSDKATF
jgi:hypothetical protein